MEWSVCLVLSSENESKFLHFGATGGVINLNTTIYDLYSTYRRLKRDGQASFDTRVCLKVETHWIVGDL
jgi:hypothetical protein